jgi:hypothetical protein
MLLTIVLSFIKWTLRVPFLMVQSKKRYVEQPPDFESEEYLNHAYKLYKALYGLKQAPRVWYE